MDDLRTIAGIAVSTARQRAPLSVAPLAGRLDQAACLMSAAAVALDTAAAAASAARVLAQAHGIRSARRERGQPLASRSMTSAR